MKEKTFLTIVHSRNFAAEKNQGRCDEEEELQEKYFLCAIKKLLAQPSLDKFQTCQMAKNQRSIHHVEIQKMNHFEKKKQTKHVFQKSKRT